VRHAPAHQPAHRLIPSRFPPIGLFDAVARAADLEAVMDLVGWTNDRLVAERIARLPPSEWVYGRPNASIVMAAFLHVAPGGMRFNGPELGAWYAADTLTTAAAEVGHHLRREGAATGAAQMVRTYRAYSSQLVGDYLDISGEALPEIYASDSYQAGQRFGEAARAAGEDGILYDSVRRRGGVNAAAYRPTKVLDIVQTEHFSIRVMVAGRRIEVHRLASS